MESTHIILNEEEKERQKILITQLLAVPTDMSNFKPWEIMQPDTTSRVIQNLESRAKDQTKNLLNNDASELLEKMREIQYQERSKDSDSQLEIFEEIFLHSLPSLSEKIGTSYKILKASYNSNQVELNNEDIKNWNDIVQLMVKNKHYMQQNGNNQKTFDNFMSDVSGAYLVGLSQQYNTQLTGDKLDALRKFGSFKNMTKQAQIFSYIGSTPSAISLFLEYSNENIPKDEKTAKNLMNNIIKELILQSKIVDEDFIKSFQKSQPELFNDILITLKANVDNEIKALQNNAAVVSELQSINIKTNNLKTKHAQLTDEIKELSKKTFGAGKSIKKVNKQIDEINKEIMQLNSRRIDIYQPYTDKEATYNNINEAIGNTNYEYPDIRSLFEKKEDVLITNEKPKDEFISNEKLKKSHSSRSLKSTKDIIHNIDENDVSSKKIEEKRPSLFKRSVSQKSIDSSKISVKSKNIEPEKSVKISEEKIEIKPKEKMEIKPNTNSPLEVAPDREEGSKKIEKKSSSRSLSLSRSISFSNPKTVKHPISTTTSSSTNTNTNSDTSVKKPGKK